MNLSWNEIVGVWVISWTMIFGSEFVRDRSGYLIKYQQGSWAAAKGSWGPSLVIGFLFALIPLFPFLWAVGRLKKGSHSTEQEALVKTFEVTCWIYSAGLLIVVIACFA